ncbi:hypothetical protein Bbelb_385060 [Branchiostoma belcheri]|nr:hypothetical protein Bbelb_385060 [Branchiostoma belcheri]
MLEANCTGTTSDLHNYIAKLRSVPLISTGTFFFRYNGFVRQYLRSPPVANDVMPTGQSEASLTCPRDVSITPGRFARGRCFQVSGQVRCRQVRTAQINSDLPLTFVLRRSAEKAEVVVSAVIPRCPPGGAARVAARGHTYPTRTAHHHVKTRQVTDANAVHKASSHTIYSPKEYQQESRQESTRSRLGSRVKHTQSTRISLTNYRFRLKSTRSRLRSAEILRIPRSFLRTEVQGIPQACVILLHLARRREHFKDAANTCAVPSADPRPVPRQVCGTFPPGATCTDRPTTLTPQGGPSFATLLLQADLLQADLLQNTGRFATGRYVPHSRSVRSARPTNNFHT